jgi:uncharacterized protein (TIGR02118 family)
MDRRAVLALGVASAATLQTGASARGETTGAGSGVVKLIAIYDPPDDPAAFFRHYETVHAPLVRKTPGLQSLVLNRVTETLVGSPCVLIAEMTYPDRATFEAAMQSPENQAVGQDLQSFAKGKVSVVVADSSSA